MNYNNIKKNTFTFKSFIEQLIEKIVDIKMSENNNNPLKRNIRLVKKGKNKKPNILVINYF